MPKNNRFIKKINDLPQGLKLGLYGSGNAGLCIKDKIESERKDLNIECFFDSEKEGEINNLKVIRFNENTNYNEICDIILICSSFWIEIESKIKSSATKAYAIAHPYLYNPSGFLYGSEFKPYVIKKEYKDDEYLFYIGDYVGESWYAKGKSPLYSEIDFLIDNIIDENDVVLECGGHHGISALLLSKYVKKLITFEPNPKNIPIINQNIKLNKIKNITSECKALGKSHSKLKMSDRSCSTILTDNKIDDVNLDRQTFNDFMDNYQYEIDVIPLDDYIHLKPTVLKIDVEGYEVEVLKGAKEILKTNPKLEIEIHSPSLLKKHNSKVEDIFELIDFSNYNCWIQWKDGEIPREYNGTELITYRVHLFAIPK